MYHPMWWAYDITKYEITIVDFFCTVHTLSNVSAYFRNLHDLTCSTSMDVKEVFVFNLVSPFLCSHWVQSLVYQNLLAAKDIILCCLKCEMHLLKIKREQNSALPFLERNDIRMKSYYCSISFKHAHHLSISSMQVWGGRNFRFVPGNG